MNTEQHKSTLKEFCDNCEAECEKNGTVPECWGQYGNPCSNYFDERDRLDKEVQDEAWNRRADNG